MEKKLYCVRVILYVMAENASEARVAATKANFDIFECTARKAERVDAGWENCIPYNADDDLTCAELLANQPSPQASMPSLGRSMRLEPALRAAMSSAAGSSPG